MAGTRDLLMDEAERGVRTGGYNSVSFRDLADALGIKSASVHYHFRKKEDLGVALVDRYSKRFFEALAAQAEPESTDAGRISAYCRTYREALTSSDAICLCGMLGAETSGLPEVVSAAVRRFFEANLVWLSDTLSGGEGGDHADAQAAQILATLQGAMMLSHNMDDIRVFDAAAAAVLPAG